VIGWEMFRVELKTKLAPTSQPKAGGFLNKGRPVATKKFRSYWWLFAAH
jgi:hypothetical protein